MKTFPSADAVNTITGPQLPKYISHAFGPLDQPWKPGYLRSHLLPTFSPRIVPMAQAG